MTAYNKSLWGFWQQMNPKWENGQSQKAEEQRTSLRSYQWDTSNYNQVMISLRQFLQMCPEGSSTAATCSQLPIFLSFPAFSRLQCTNCPPKECRLLVAHSQSVANLISVGFLVLAGTSPRKTTQVVETAARYLLPQKSAEAGYPVSISAKLGGLVSKVLLVFLGEAGYGQSRDPCKAGKPSSQGPTQVGTVWPFTGQYLVGQGIRIVKVTLYEIFFHVLNFNSFYLVYVCIHVNRGIYMPQHKYGSHRTTLGSYITQAGL